MTLDRNSLVRDEGKSKDLAQTLEVGLQRQVSNHSKLGYRAHPGENLL